MDRGLKSGFCQKSLGITNKKNMNTQFKASSVIYGFNSEFFKTKEELLDSYDFAEDLIIHEIDVDDRDYILRDVPAELKGCISWMAYESGHYAGESRVAYVMRNLVNDLLPAILAYGIRVKKEK